MDIILDFLLNYLATIAGVILGICYIPQVVHTVKTKNVEGLSLSFWLILNVAIFLLFVNAVTIYIQFGTWGYMLTELFNFGLAFVMIVLVLKYRKKK